MKFNGLKCACGGELELDVAYDGQSEEAVRYHHQHDHNWGYVVGLCCTKCSRVYHIARTDSHLSVSAIKDGSFGGVCRSLRREASQ